MSQGIPYELALRAYEQADAASLRDDALDVAALLAAFHPDYGANARVLLQVGANRGDSCQPDVARLLQSNVLIDDVDLAGAQLASTDVLVIGGGGAGCAMARRSGGGVTLGGGATGAAAGCPPRSPRRRRAASA